MKKIPRTINELPSEKICTGCKNKKGKDQFRIRDKKYKGESRYYLSPRCKGCENEEQKIRYLKIKDDLLFKKKNHQRAKDYCKKNKTRIKQKNSIKRQTDKYKTYVKEYRKKNKAKIQQQETVTKNRYHSKNRDPITDKYVIRQLISQGYGSKEQVMGDKELIELKRIQILNKRIKMEIIKKQKYGKENN